MPNNYRDTLYTFTFRENVDEFDEWVRYAKKMLHDAEWELAAAEAEVTRKQRGVESAKQNLRTAARQHRDRHR